MPTNYAGEAYRIQTTSETDFDGNTLVPDVVSYVQLQIFNADFTETVVDTNMDYDTDISHWAYEWDTTGVDPGTYKAMVKIVFADGTYSLEGPTRIRLKVDPRP